MSDHAKKRKKHNESNKAFYDRAAKHDWELDHNGVKLHQFAFSFGPRSGIEKLARVHDFFFDTYAKILTFISTATNEYEQWILINTPLDKRYYVPLWKHEKFRSSGDSDLYNFDFRGNDATSLEDFKQGVYDALGNLTALNNRFGRLKEDIALGLYGLTEVGALWDGSINQLLHADVDFGTELPPYSKEDKVNNHTPPMTLIIVMTSNGRKIGLLQKGSKDLKVLHIDSAIVMGPWTYHSGLATTSRTGDIALHLHLDHLKYPRICRNSVEAEIPRGISLYLDQEGDASRLFVRNHMRLPSINYDAYGVFKLLDEDGLRWPNCGSGMNASTVGPVAQFLPRLERFLPKPQDQSKWVCHIISEPLDRICFSGFMQGPSFFLFIAKDNPLKISIGPKNVGIDISGGYCLLLADTVTWLIHSGDGYLVPVCTDMTPAGAAWTSRKQKATVEKIKRATPLVIPTFV